MATATEIDLDALLRPLACQASALIRAAALGELWGMDQDSALDLAAELEAVGGWLLSWDVPNGEPCLILSSRAAARLGIELEPPDDLVVGRWIPIGSSKPTPYPRHSRLLTETDALRPDDAPPGSNAARGLDGVRHSRAFEAADIVAALDDPPAAEATRGGRRVEIEPALPRPTHLLGFDDVWPVAPDDGERCGSCHGLKLALDTYCLTCDSCGLEQRGMLPRVADTPRQNHTPSERNRKLMGGPVALAGGKGKVAKPKAAKRKKVDLIVKAPKPKKVRQADAPPGFRMPKHPPGVNAFDLKALRERLEREAG